MRLAVASKLHMINIVAFIILEVSMYLEKGSWLRVLAECICFAFLGVFLPLVVAEREAV